MRGRHLLSILPLIALWTGCGGVVTVHGGDDGAVTEDLIDLELEDVLQRDDVGLHPLNLGDRSDAPRAVL